MSVIAPFAPSPDDYFSTCVHAAQLVGLHWYNCAIEATEPRTRRRIALRWMGLCPACHAVGGPTKLDACHPPARVGDVSDFPNALITPARHANA